MKHLLALSTLYPNAANPRFGTFVARSLEALAKRGDWRVSVINPIGLPPMGLGALSDRYRELRHLPEQEMIGGVTVHHPRFTLIPKVGAKRNVAAITKAALPIAQAIAADIPIDVVDAQFFFPDGPAAATLARNLGKVLSIKARGSDITYWGTIPHARDAMVKAANEAAGILSVSEALKRDMQALGMVGDKIAIHYTGLDRDLFRPLGHTQLRAQLGKELGFPLPLDAPVFACVGALIPRKGHDIAIKALAQLKEESPDARLILVGKGDEEASLRNLARECGVAERVYFTGSIDHNILPLILSAADVMVLPTDNEGLANVWVEALACGTPVVTCDVGGARELITNDIAGRLVERTQQGVADGLRSVLNQPHDPQNVAALVEHFDWASHATALAGHYARLTRL